MTTPFLLLLVVHADFFVGAHNETPPFPPLPPAKLDSPVFVSPLETFPADPSFSLGESGNSILSLLDSEKMRFSPPLVDSTPPKTSDPFSLFPRVPVFL